MKWKLIRNLECKTTGKRIHTCIGAVCLTFTGKFTVFFLERWTAREVSGLYAQ
jgi:hypothetical protein